MVKKFITYLFILLIMITNIATQQLNAHQDEYLMYATKVANEFIANSSDKEYGFWNDMHISDYYSLYDFNDQISGFVFNVTNGTKEGFVLVQVNSDELVVSKASSESKFEYLPLLKSGSKIYSTTPFEFYSKTTTKQNDSFMNLETKNVEVVKNFKSSKINIPTSNITQRGIETEGPDAVYYLAGPADYLPSIIQSQKACLATSATILLMYYKNMRYYMYSGLEQDEILNKLKSSSYIGIDKKNFDDYKYGITKFLNEVGRRGTVTYKTSDLQLGRTLYDSEIIPMKDWIMNNNVIITIAGSDSYPNSDVSGSVLHAVVTFGIKQMYNGKNYLVTRDPLTSSLIELYWDTYNSKSRQYFGIYGIAYTTIN